MAIEYSVIGIASSGNQEISLPTNTGTIVAIGFDGIMELTLSPERTAVLVGSNQMSNAGEPLYLPVTYRPSGQKMKYNNVIASAFVVFYFGTPLPNAKPLAAYSGEYITNVFSSAGTVTPAVTFPSGSVALTGVLIGMNTSGNVLFSFATDSGKSLSLQYQSVQVQGTGSIFPLTNIKAANSLTVTITASSALTAYVVIYYQ